MNFLKTKYYPCSIDDRKIIDVPYKRERDVFLKHKGTNFIGTKGDRLNRHSCYNSFTVINGE